MATNCFPLLHLLLSFAVVARLDVSSEDCRRFNLHTCLSWCTRSKSVNNCCCCSVWVCVSLCEWHRHVALDSCTTTHVRHLTGRFLQRPLWWIIKIMMADYCHNTKGSFWSIPVLSIKKVSDRHISGSSSSLPCFPCWDGLLWLHVIDFSIFFFFAFMTLQI